MSNEKINEAQVEQATSQENENAAANVTPSILNQNVEDIIAERDALKMKVDELEAELKTAKEATTRRTRYWMAEEKKVKLLLNFIKSGVNPSECMTAGDLIAKIIDRLD